MSESVIADDLHIKGELTTNGDVELKGTVEGEIVCRTLWVAEDARINGAAAAEKVIVRGTVDGTINGNRVTLTASARVKGELVCKALSIDEEAYFDGRSQRVEDPLQEVNKKRQAEADAQAASSKNDASKGDKDKDKAQTRDMPLAASGVTK